MIANLEAMFACKFIKDQKEVNSKWPKLHQDIIYINQSTIEKVHFIFEQTMKITYVVNMSTLQ